MTIREITTTALLGALLYVVYTLGSFFLYAELFNFTILLYGTYLSRKQAWWAVMLFSILLILTRGLSPWSIVYTLIFPQYALIYSFVKNKLKSEYALASLGFFLAFICGTLIDLPYIFMADLGKEALILRFLMGFQASLGNGVCTFIATLFLLKPLGRALERANQYVYR
ncbi:MAG: hypothetical protein ACI35O_12130 [Bacillaceae bacterium]